MSDANAARPGSAAETIDLPPRFAPRDDNAASAGDSRGSPTPDRHVAMVRGSGPELAGVTDALRRERLRAAAAGLFLAFLLSHLGWTFIVGNPRWGMQFLDGIALIVAWCVLASKARLGPRVLTALELAIFVSAGLDLAIQQYNLVLLQAHEGDATALVGTVKNVMIGTLILTFVHSMLIPNTIWGSARMVALLWSIPLISQSIAIGLNPEARRFAREVATSERIAENGLIVLISSILAVYGAHVLNTLRREAFEARRVSQYRLRKLLGRGGMGEVYLAEHRLLKRPCAIKLIRPGTRADPRVLARFEREVRTTATLSHPNTIEIYDYGRTDDGTFYYVMEYLRGLSLEDLVARHGPQPPARVIHLLRQACAALTEAHAQGMVHRDLKPANLFASVRGGVFDTVKVLDFGLVKPLAPLSDAPELSTDGRVQGTPQYMPPEQATGQKIDPRADLYALGGVAYHLLTGRAPFEGDNAVLMLIAQARDPVVPPSQRQPGIPADLEAVVLRCLAKSPDERYPDAASVSRALARCAAASGWGNDEAAAWWAAHESLATRLPAPEDDDPITDVDDGSDLNGSTDATAAAAPPLALPALDGDSPR